MADQQNKPESKAASEQGSGGSGKPVPGVEPAGAETKPQAGQAAPVKSEEAVKPAAPAKPAAPTTAIAGAAKPDAPAAAGAPGAAKPAPPAAAGAPGVAKPVVPPRPAPAPVPKPEAWDDDFSRHVRENLGDAVKESLKFLDQRYFIVDAARITEVCEYLRDEEEFDYLADLTAVDYPKKEKRFEIVYQLYSFPRNIRLRMKAVIGENETIASVVPVWSTANWLEREVFDMFGVRFEGHPDLKRILLPEGWQGYPLRKDYNILQQDTQWVQENLHIESGQ